MWSNLDLQYHWTFGWNEKNLTIGPHNVETCQSRGTAGRLLSELVSMAKQSAG